MPDTPGKRLRRQVKEKRRQDKDARRASRGERRDLGESQNPEFGEINEQGLDMLDPDEVVADLARDDS